MSRVLLFIWLFGEEMSLRYLNKGVEDQKISGPGNQRAPWQRHCHRSKIFPLLNKVPVVPKFPSGFTEGDGEQDMEAIEV